MLKAVLVSSVVAAALSFTAPPSAASGRTYKDTCAQQCAERGMVGSSAAKCTANCEQNRKNRER